MQDDGKFCGKCGTPISARVEEVSTSEEAATVVSQPQFDSNANVGHQLDRLHNTLRIS